MTGVGEKDKALSSGDIVVVVEPDVLARMVIADYLRECGFRVVECVSAAEVRQVLEAGHGVKVVFSEVNLPGGVDGFMLATELRQTRPEVAIILTSSVAGAANKAAELCDDGLLEKPYEPQEAVRRINMLRQRRGRGGPP